MRANALPSEAMRTAIQAGMLTLVAKAQRTRFSGKGPFPVSERKLGLRTGRLRRDLHAETVRITAGGYAGRIGSVVNYFGAHERGFSGTVSVRAHTRDGYTVKKRGYSVLPQTVRGHSRRVDIPKRAPLAAAIEEHGNTILGNAIKSGIRKQAR
jgi:hypothetical protein